jgi:hypothetical protein
MAVRQTFKYRDCSTDSIHGVDRNQVLRGCAGEVPLRVQWGACGSKDDFYSFAVGWVGGIEGSRY